LDQLASGIEVVVSADVASLSDFPTGSVSAAYSADGFAGKVDVACDLSLSASAVIGGTPSEFFTSTTSLF